MSGAAAHSLLLRRRRCFRRRCCRWRGRRRNRLCWRRRRRSRGRRHLPSLFLSLQCLVISFLGLRIRAHQRSLCLSCLRVRLRCCFVPLLLLALLFQFAFGHGACRLRSRRRRSSRIRRAARSRRWLRPRHRLLRLCPTREHRADRQRRQPHRHHRGTSHFATSPREESPQTLKMSFPPEWVPQRNLLARCTLPQDAARFSVRFDRKSIPSLAFPFHSARIL